MTLKTTAADHVRETGRSVGDVSIHFCDPSQRVLIRGCAAGCDGQLWLTHATVDGQRYGYVLAPELASNYTLSLAELGYRSGGDVKFVATRHHAVSRTGSPSPLPSTTIPVESSVGIQVYASTAVNFEVVLLSPALSGGWYLLTAVHTHTLMRQRAWF